jgi:hypothetical protein
MIAMIASRIATDLEDTRAGRWIHRLPGLKAR